MAKHTRKGKNPGPVDSWLDTLGYYRKNVAYDETCLFRAISEQMFSCQIYHERCRKEIIEYGRNNYEVFLDLMPREKWFEHLRKLEVHMAICGPIEMKIISKKYKKEIVLFDGTHKRTINVTDNKFDDSFLLCLMGEDHYDVVYKKETIQTAGFCQSIAYGVLYENVFKIPNVPKIVQTMLYEKTSLMMVNSECDEQNLKNNEKAKQGKDIVKYTDAPPEKGFSDYEYMLQTNIAPFPFKVAKALDPTIYRNIEYDTWTETRKELRLGQWYYGDNNLILGTCCLLATEHGTQQCYIQEILKQEDKCVVYITNLAEKRTVKYSELSPETDAKPWPLPYRFARNVVIQPVKVETSDVNNNMNKRSLRRRRDKKRSPSKSSTDSVNSLTLAITPDVNDNSIKAFEGCPLQIQQNLEEYENQQPNQSGDGNQQGQYSEVVYPVDQSWNKAATPENEQVIWPQSPMTQHMYTVLQKHVYPVTPEATYAEPYYYVPHYQGWATSPDHVQAPEYQIPQSPQMDIPMSPDPYGYFYESYPSPVPPVSMQTMPPMSPQVEMYQPVYQTTAPVTPVIYTGTPDMQEMMIASTPNDMMQGMYTPMYSPAIDMSYMPSPYIYPPTPPATWYRPPAINSQGFIFPTPQK